MYLITYLTGSNPRRLSAVKVKRSLQWTSLSIIFF